MEIYKARRYHIAIFGLMAAAAVIWAHPLETSISNVGSQDSKETLTLNSLIELFNRSPQTGASHSPSGFKYDLSAAMSAKSSQKLPTSSPTGTETSKSTWTTTSTPQGTIGPPSGTGRPHPGGSSSSPIGPGFPLVAKILVPIGSIVFLLMAYYCLCCKSQRNAANTLKMASSEKSPGESTGSAVSVEAKPILRSQTRLLDFEERCQVDNPL